MKIPKKPYLISYTLVKKQFTKNKRTLFTLLRLFNEMRKRVSRFLKPSIKNCRTRKFPANLFCS